MVTFLMPMAELSYQYNTLVLLGITIAETGVQWFESLLHQSSAHHDEHHGHDDEHAALTNHSHHE